MKKTYYIMMMFALVFTTACSKDNEQEHESEIVHSHISMTVQYKSVTITLAGAGKVTVDWGDKSFETRTLKDYGLVGWQFFNHTYADDSDHIITITGDSVTWFSNINTGCTVLDVSKNPALEIMSCADNRLKILDVSQNPALRTLYCYNNALTSLDVSQNPDLRILGCYKNPITKLDFSNNKQLGTLFIHNMSFTSDAFNEMFKTLHNFLFPGRTKIIFIGADSGTNGCDKSIAENKGWFVTNEIYEFK